MMNKEVGKEPINSLFLADILKYIAIDE